MKNFLGLTACLILSLTVQAKELAGVQLPESITVEQQSLQLNGAGIRSKFFMDLYVGSLYTGKPVTDPADVINAATPVAIQLDITSGLITSEKMVDSINDGFVAATGNKLAPLQIRLDQFIALFNDEIKEGDQFLLVKNPDQGVDAYKNGKRLATIEGDDFGQTLFNIWLGKKPADKGLKKAMLGQ